MQDGQSYWHVQWPKTNASANLPIWRNHSCLQQREWDVAGRRTKICQALIQRHLSEMNVTVVLSIADRKEKCMKHDSGWPTINSHEQTQRTSEDDTDTNHKTYKSYRWNPSRRPPLRTPSAPAMERLTTFHNGLWNRSPKWRKKPPIASNGRAMGRMDDSPCIAQETNKIQNCCTTTRGWKVLETVAKLRKRTKRTRERQHVTTETDTGHRSISILKRHHMRQYMKWQNLISKYPLMSGTIAKPKYWHRTMIRLAKFFMHPATCTGQRELDRVRSMGHTHNCSRKWELNNCRLQALNSNKAVDICC